MVLPRHAFFPGVLSARSMFLPQHAFFSAYGFFLNTLSSQSKVSPQSMVLPKHGSTKAWFLSLTRFLPMTCFLLKAHSFSPRHAFFHGS
jgi:hypothetical protein